MRQILVVVMLLAMAQAVSQEDIPELTIEAIEEGVYLHKSYSRVEGFGLVSSNGLVVVDGGKAFIVDTPWSGPDTEKLVAWISGNNYDLLGSVSTHSHEDRAGGVKWLNAHSVPTYATELTNKILKSEGKETTKYSYEGPEESLADGLVEVFYPGGGHTVDNVVVWLPKSKILFGGCFVRSQSSKSLGYTGEADIKNWSVSVERVLEKYVAATHVIPGHGEVGGVHLLRHTKELIDLTLARKIDSKSDLEHSK